MHNEADDGETCAMEGKTGNSPLIEGNCPIAPFTRTRLNVEIINSIKQQLLGCGLAEVHTSKAVVPLELPAGVVTLISLAGDKKTSTGYVDYTFKAECFIAVENNDNADEVLLGMLTLLVGNGLAHSAGVCGRGMPLPYAQMASNIDEVDFYDSMLGPRDVRIAKFDITWQGGIMHNA